MARTNKTKRIFPQQWVMKNEPYDKVGPADKFYCDLYNKIMTSLATPIMKAAISEAPFLTEEMVAYLCTGYLEDKATGLGIWTCIREAFLEKYGTRIPFFDTSDDDDPALPDRREIALLLWSILFGSLDQESYIAISPFSPRIEVLSTALGEILAEEYPNAPSNDRLYDCIIEADLNSNPLSLTKALIWTSRCYAFPKFYDYAAEDYLEEMMDNIDDEEDQEFGPVIEDFLFSGIFDYRCSPACLTPCELLGLLRGDAALAQAKHVKLAPFKVLSKDKESYLVENLITEEKLTLMPDMMDSESFRTLVVMDKSHTEGVIECISSPSFVHVLYIKQSDTFSPTIYELIDKHKQLRMAKQALTERTGIEFEKIRKVHPDKDLFFFPSGTEVEDFLQGCGINADDILNTPLPSVPTLLTVDPIHGVQCHTDIVKCINHPDNPFFDKKEAEANTLEFLAVPCGNSEFSVMSKCIRKGYFTDGRMPDRDHDRGRKTLLENAQFILDFSNGRNTASLEKILDRLDEYYMKKEAEERLL